MEISVLFWQPLCGVSLSEGSIGVVCGARFQLFWFLKVSFCPNFLSLFITSSSDSSEDKKPVSASEVVPMMSKITEDKLIGPNYLDWSKTIRLYLRIIRMTSHLDKDPPINDSKERWLEDDARLFLQILNSIDSKVLTLINDCEFVKELMDYLEFVYSSKGNISRIFDVCRAFYPTKKQDRSLTELFMDYKKT